MRSRLSLLLLCAALCAALPATASAKGFKSGVASAEVSSTSAVLWTRADRPGTITLELARSRSFDVGLKSTRLRAAKSTDLTVQTTAGALKPGTRYYFRFLGKGSARSDRGTFRTAPSPTSARPVTFGWTGDSDPVKTASGKLLNAPFDIFARMSREGNDFNVNLGDTIYSDSDSPRDRVDPLAISVAQKRQKYRDMLSAASLRKLRGSGGMFNHWDDHEFLNDFAIDQTSYPTRSGTPEGSPGRVVTVDGHKLYRDGVKAFREYMPVTYSKSNGIYRTVRWGKNLELFFLDERSFRSAGADDGGVCDNPAGSGQRDLAPTAPQRIRALFAFIVPALAAPPPPACVARVNDPNRTFLGSRQLANFTSAIKRSDATFKVVMNEMPIQQFYADPYDRWEGYEPERKKVLTFLRANVKNVVFLTTDVHANLVNDARLLTLEAGGPENSGILEVTTGPSGTDTFKQDLNDEANNPQAGDLINSAFLTQQPPNGPGIQCSQLDAFSYGQVTVTSGRLTITLRDGKGKAVVGADGKPCGPYVIARK
jgi:alkaline phosphatase D